MSHSAGDFIRRITRETELAALKKYIASKNMAANSRGSGQAGCLNGARTKVTLADGSTWPCKVVGNPPECCFVQLISPGQYLAIGSKPKFINLDGSKCTMYVILRQGADRIFGGGNCILIDVSNPSVRVSIPSPPDIGEGFPAGIFSPDGKSIAVLGFNTISSNFGLAYIVYKHWAITKDTHGIPTFSYQSSVSGFFTTATEPLLSAYNEIDLPYTLLSNDSSGNPRLQFVGCFNNFTFGDTGSTANGFYSITPIGTTNTGPDGPLPLSVELFNNGSFITSSTAEVFGLAQGYPIVWRGLTVENNSMSMILLKNGSVFHPAKPTLGQYYGALTSIPTLEFTASDAAIAATPEHLVFLTDVPAPVPVTDSPAALLIPFKAIQNNKFMGFYWNSGDTTVSIKLAAYSQTQLETQPSLKYTQNISKKVGTAFDDITVDVVNGVIDYYANGSCGTFVAP